MASVAPYTSASWALPTTMLIFYDCWYKEHIIFIMIFIFFFRFYDNFFCGSLILCGLDKLAHCLSDPGVGSPATGLASLAPYLHRSMQLSGLTRYHAGPR